mmetsp:Transcript_3716/g.10544  ORF Transcript_3716/g.10544 Transcript_3716/m.10544 type:complete len:212 (+) Transcript_3716:4052-4687(+)
MPCIQWPRKYLLESFRRHSLQNRRDLYCFHPYRRRPARDKVQYRPHRMILVQLPHQTFPYADGGHRTPMTTPLHSRRNRMAKRSNLDRVAWPDEGTSPFSLHIPVRCSCTSTVQNTISFHLGHCHPAPMNHLRQLGRACPEHRSSTHVQRRLVCSDIQDTFSEQRRQRSNQYRRGKQSAQTLLWAYADDSEMKQNHHPSAAFGLLSAGSYQ